MHGYETEKKPRRAYNMCDKDPAKAMHNRSRNHRDPRVPRDEFENLQIGGYDEDASSVSSLSHVSGKFAKREKREKKKGLLSKIVKSVAKSAARKSSSKNRHEDGIDFRKVIRRSSINTAIETDEGCFGTSGHDAGQDYHTHDSISRVSDYKKTSVASGSSYDEDSISSLDSAIEQAKSRNAGVKPSSRSHSYQKRELVVERRKTSRKYGLQSNELSRDKNKEEQKKTYVTSHYYRDDDSFTSFDSKYDHANSKGDNINGDKEDKKKTYSTRRDFQDDSSFISFNSKDDRVISKKKSPHGDFPRLREKRSSRSSRHHKAASEVEGKKRSRRRRPQDIEANENSTEEQEKASIASRQISDNDSISSSGSYLEDTHSRSKSMHDDKSRCSKDSDEHARCSKPRRHSKIKVEQDEDKRRSRRNHQDNESKSLSSRKSKAVDSGELQSSNRLQERGDTKSNSTESPGLDQTIKGRSIRSLQSYRSQSDGSLHIETKTRSQMDDESKNDDKKSRGHRHKNKISLESIPKNVSVSDRGPRSLYPESSSNKKLGKKKSGSKLEKGEASRKRSCRQSSDQKSAKNFTSFKSTPHISEQYFRSSQGKLDDDDKSYDYYLRDDSKKVLDQRAACDTDQGCKSKKTKEEEYHRRDSLKSLSRYIRAEKELKYAKSKEPSPTHCQITPSSNKGVGTLGRKTQSRRPFPAGDDPHLMTISINENKHRRNHQVSASSVARERTSSSRKSKSHSSKTSLDMYYDGKNSSSKKKHHHSSSSGIRLSSDHNKEHGPKSKRSKNKEEASSKKDVSTQALSDAGKARKDNHGSSSEGPELSMTRQRALRRSSSKKSLDNTKEDLDASEATMSSNRGRRSNKKENEDIDRSETGTIAHRSVSSSKTTSSKRAGKKAEYLSNLFDNSKSSAKKEDISLVRDEERKSSDHLNDLFTKKKSIPLKHHQYGRR